MACATTTVKKVSWWSTGESCIGHTFDFDCHGVGEGAESNKSLPECRSHSVEIDSRKD